MFNDFFIKIYYNIYRKLRKELIKMDDYNDISLVVASVAFMFIEVAIMLFIWNTALIPWFCFLSITYWQMFVIKIFINIAVPSRSKE